MDPIHLVMIVDFAERVDDEIDIIYGAHNHTYANTTIDHKLIIQSYSSGTAFSDVDILIDPMTKDIVEKKAKIVRTYHKGMEPDTRDKGNGRFLSCVYRPNHQ